MSLNWKEINLILEELNLPGCTINTIIQENFRNIFFQLYRPEEKFWLHVCLDPQSLRIHRSNRLPRKPQKPLRFHEFLRANLTRGRIVHAEQWGTNRIIQLNISHSTRMHYGIIRLWEGRENLIITDTNYLISEVCFRRPRQGLQRGQRFEIPSSQPIEKELRSYEGTFNEYIERIYEEKNTLVQQQSQHQQILQFIARQRKHLTQKLLQQKKTRDPQGSQQKGDLILVHLNEIHPGDTKLTISGMMDILLDAKLNGVKNAQRYYERARKIRNEVKRFKETLKYIQQQLTELENAEKDYLQERDASTIQKLLKQEVHTSPPIKKEFLTFSSGEYRIIVGRNAKENDLLLRKHVRGNDTWLHVRDFSGSHVFIRNHRAKVPLPQEVLLDAAALALHFSKGRQEAANVYVTQVKYLRRQKHGVLGSLIPFHEKNLYITYDVTRLRHMGVGT